MPFHLSLGLGPTRTAGDRSKTVMGCKPQKSSVVNRLVAVVSTYHDFHVVIKTSRGHSSQVFKCADVFADRGGEVLRLDEVQILAARITEDITESMNAAPSLSREIKVVSGIIHLGLLARCSLESPHRLDTRTRTQNTYPLAHARVAPLIAKSPQ